MSAGSDYWSQLLEVVQKHRYWLRVAWRDGDVTEPGQWGMLLGLPVEGYLEGPDGPWPLRDVEWVEVSISSLKGGMLGRPLEILDRSEEELLAGLRATQLDWEVRDSSWSVEGIFEDERPVRLVRIVNPFFAPNSNAK